MASSLQEIAIALALALPSAALQMSTHVVEKQWISNASLHMLYDSRGLSPCDVNPNVDRWSDVYPCRCTIANSATEPTCVTGQVCTAVDGCKTYAYAGERVRAKPLFETNSGGTCPGVTGEMGTLVEEFPPWKPGPFLKLYFDNPDFTECIYGGSSFYVWFPYFMEMYLEKVTPSPTPAPTCAPRCADKCYTYLGSGEDYTGHPINSSWAWSCFTCKCKGCSECSQPLCAKHCYNKPTQGWRTGNEFGWKCKINDCLACDECKTPAPTPAPTPVPTPPTPAPTPAPTAPKVTGVIKMNHAPSKCISSSAGSTENGNNVQIWDCGSGAAFEFTMPAWGPGYIRMANSPNKCISASAAETWNGNNVQIWECGDGSPTAFEFVLP